MPHSLTLQINPESLNFLNQHKKKHLSSAQKIFTVAVKKVHEELSCLKEKTLFTFTAENEFELSRGNFYAITESLQKKCPQEKISLENLQAALENDLFIRDKETLSFIILCLVEPVWLPGALGLIAYSVLPSTSYICSNQSQPDPLKATIGTDQAIFFQFKLNINAITTEETLPRGTTIIDFIVNNGEVQLLPIKMQFNFQDKQESIQFRQALTNNFKTWLLHSNELTRIQNKLQQAALLNCDLCVIPSLLGLLTGLIVMVSFITLNLSIISAFLLPPLGLALGLIVASLAISCAYIDKKREEKKLQRPLYLFNKQFTKPQASHTTQTSPTLPSSFSFHPR